MASPHTPYHPQPGPSYYHHPPPPPPPPHYGYSPAPAPAPYYAYPMPPMNGPAPMHQPSSPRINGAGRGRYNPHRGGGPAYHYQAMPPHHHMPPPAVPVQTPPPVSPASPFHHPQKFAHPHPHQVPYGSPYHHPQPNGPYPHAWPGPTLSPLPKQMSMLPPMLSSEPVPQIQQPQPPQPPQPQLQPPPIPETLQQSHQPPAEMVEYDTVITPSSASVHHHEQEHEQEHALETLEVAQSQTNDTQPEAADAADPQSSGHAPADSVPPSFEVESELEAASSGTSSPALTISISLPSDYVIWSRRPGNPTRAPGVIISSRAFPPEEVLRKALELPSPPPSPKVQQIPIAEAAAPLALDVQESSSESTGVPSSSTTETTPSCSVAADTPVPGSPYSSATSVSAAVGSPSGKTMTSPHADSKVELSPPTELEVGATKLSAPQPGTEETPVTTPTVAASTTPTPAKPAVPPPKKSWASLLQPSDATASSSKSRLPVSHVIGYSVPATAGAAATPSPAASLASANRNELLHLLNEGPSSSSANHATAMKIRPRGLVNTGNMCFANAVLQVLVYCPPFHRFFSELRKHLAGPVVGSQREGSKATPLVDATIQFLKEFVPDPPAPTEANSKSKGKEREDDGFDELESFIPTYVYDAMKEKKRFANMIGGYQEDAEEFLGFFLDTLEEELLSISQSLQPKEPAPEEPTQDDGWMEVGKKNKAVVTRTAKSTESPITRIFGGKFRSTLRAPHQRESVTIEDWRSLQLDIQPEDVKTLRDALQHISHPQPVQISIPTRPGALLEASQQVLIDALPHVLIMHMKRFHYDTKVGDVVKVSKQVSFSQDLDIPAEIISSAKRTAQPVKYQLFGVLYHHGSSASGGHYTLDVLHPNRECTDRPRSAWIRIDDELVSDVRPEDVFGSQDREDRQPYLLFYRRVTAWGAARTN